MPSPAGRAKTIFLDALEIDAGPARALFVTTACGDDRELRRRVEALIAAHERQDALLGHDGEPRVGPLGPRPDGAPVGSGEGPGTVIGPYVLGSVLGEGGMGVVYRAEQSQPVRRAVAFKIIKPGMDSRQVIARFEVERQALAMMDHPNIARVFDAGTTGTGRPYFVMELVDGLPITRYCAHAGLSERERLELFILVCRAVQHAHQKGIIHRDLKPSNVLVMEQDGVAVPKVIDFGIAKATGLSLTDLTLHTSAAQMVGSPLYMSPEQAEPGRLDVDTRADVYSLGVLLYELLTGTTPFGRERLKSASYDEIRRILREEEPPPPSARVHTPYGDATTVLGDATPNDQRLPTHQLRGELDWIVMKCLEKDRTRRYDTANSLAADLIRYLNDQPVEAGPPSSLYRMRKAMRRHRVGLTTALVVSVVLVTGAVASFWQAIRATQAEQRLAAALLVAEEKQRLADRHLFATQLRLAGEAVSDGHVERAQEILQAMTPDPGADDLRGFGWHYLWRLARRDLVQFPAHSSGVSGLVLVGDGRRIAYGTKLGEIFVADVASERIVKRLMGRPDPVKALAAAADGRWLASATMDPSGDASEVLVWDVDRGTARSRIDALRARTVHRLWLSRSGRVLSALSTPAVGDEAATLASFDLTDPAHPRALAVFRADEVSTPSEAGRVLRKQAGGELAEMDLRDGRSLRTISTGAPAIEWLGLSPDDDHAVVVTGGARREALAIDLRTATAGDQDRLDLEGQTFSQVLIASEARTVVFLKPPGDVLVWDRAGGVHRRIAVEGGDRPGASLHAALSGDGRLLTLSTAGNPGGQTLLEAFEVASGRPIARYPGRSLRLGDLVFAPDGRSLFVDSGHAIKKWRLERPRTVTIEGHRDEAWCLAFSPDGRSLLTGSDDTDEPWTLKVWDVATGRLQGQRRPHDATVSALAIAPGGKRLATASLGEQNNLKLWKVESLADPAAWTLVAAMPDQRTRVRTLAYRPDGAILASAGDDRVIHLWDGTTGAPRGELAGHENAVRQIAFRRDGRWLASASNDGTVRVWDVAARSPVTIFRGPWPFTSVAFAPTGDVLAAADQNGLITLLDPATGRERGRIYSEDSELRALGFLPGGRTLAAAGMGRAVRLWDVGTGQEELVLVGHEAQINALAVSPDGRTIASCSHDGAVKLWSSTGDGADW